MVLNRDQFRAIIFYNSASMNLIQFLAMMSYQGPVFIDEFNRGRSSLQDEFREGRPKSVVVPETINAVDQLILQDSHVTYREIDITLGVSGTSIHSILHEHLTVKKNLFALDSTRHVNCSKKGSCRLFERNAAKIRSR